MICILEITFWDSKEREPELKKGIIQVKLKKKKFLDLLDRMNESDTVSK